MKAYQIDASGSEYSQALTRDIIVNFLDPDINSRPAPTNKKRAPSATELSTYFLIKYRNTTALYCRDGYDKIDGDYEVVEADEVEWLVSSYSFMRSDNFRGIQYEPYKIRHNATTLNHRAPLPKISIIVPLYGSPRYTYAIKKEIELSLPELKSLGGRVIISIDGHASASQTSIHGQILNSLDDPDVKVFKHAKNLGFIKNVNFLFSKTPKDSIVILLTSDVKMQAGSISRIIAPLLEDPEIALTTPFAVGGENLEVPENRCLHWHDMDKILSHIKPSYPDAETTVGYLMGIDRRKYKGDKLFDSFYTNGYGDDSDLYFRCLNNGYRGVLVDNCCVFHEHGASFQLTNKRAALRKENHLRFMQRWGNVLSNRCSTSFDRQRQSRIIDSLSSNVACPQIVFLLPTNNRNIGGVSAVLSLAETLCDLGLSAAVICQKKEMSEDSFPIRTILSADSDMAEQVLTRASFFIATSHDTVSVVKELARKFGNKTAYFIQGPEFSFSDGAHLRSVITDYNGFDAIFSVSDFISGLVECFVDVDVTLVPYGPPQHHYYDLAQTREKKSIAVQLSANANKGSSYVAGVIALLISDGYRIYSFGDEKLRGKRKNFCNHLGFLSVSEKVDLFNSVEFYLDASHYEGLGLLLMESAQCGAIPVYRHNGGTADILKSSGAGIEVGDYGAIGRIKHQLAEFRDADRFAEERTRCKKALEARSVEAAAQAMLEWWNAQH